MRALNKYEFVPVHTNLLMDKFEYNGKAVTTMLENSMYPHGTFLVNPVHTKEYEFNKKRSDVVAFADSGGLQQARFEGTEMSPHKIVTWQQKYSNIGFVIDRPIFKLEQNNEGKTTLVNLQHKLHDFAKDTKEKTNEMFKFIDTPETQFKLYGILQGETYEDYEKWHKIVNDNRLAGYGLKVSETKNDSLLSAIAASFALENIDKPLHFLGVGKMLRAVLPLMFTKHFKKPISFDSSTPMVASRKRMYMLPFTNFKMEIKSEEKNPIVPFESCNCPACKAIVKENDLEIYKDNERATLFHDLMTVHGIATMNSEIKLFYSLRNNEEKFLELFEDIYGNVKSKRLEQTIDFLDAAQTKGYYETYKKYKHLAEQNNGGKQRGIFGAY